VGEFIDRITAALDRWVLAARRRSPAFDHVWRAQRRYASVDGGRLAAATAYYGFFAVFAMAVVSFFTLSRLLGNNRNVVDSVQGYLRVNLPQLPAEDIFRGSQRIGVIALIALVIAGVGWVENLRSSQRALWRLDEHPGNPIIRWLVDLAVLVALGLLLLLSIALFSGAQELLYWLAGSLEQDPLRVALRGTTPIFSGLADVGLGAALLAVVPRLRLPMRRLLLSAFVFAIGLGLLKTIGKLYITRTERNPAYQLVAGTIGLLLFMYLLHQLLLFAAALAATDTHGRVLDLAGGKPSRLPPPAAMERAAQMVDEAADRTAEAAAAAAMLEPVQGTQPTPDVGKPDTNAADTDSPIGR
jgi:membrane protein